MSTNAWPRNRLRKELERALVGLGYNVVPGPSGDALLFCFKAVDGLVLTLSIHTSSLHRERFTGMLSLSPSFTMDLVLPNFGNAYQRVPVFLTGAERDRLLPPDVQGVGIVDGWWIGFTKDSVERFAEAVALADKRFLEQPGLRDAMDKSAVLASYMKTVAAVIEEAARGEPPSRNLRFQPRQTPADVPRVWFEAAELVARGETTKVTRAYVEMIAIDAWRRSTLL